MKTADILRALAYPLTNTTVLTAFVMFYLVAEFIRWAVSTGPFFFVSGIIFAVFVTPALSLYLLYLLDARARGKHPDPPGVEHLHWYGSGWSLLQVLYFLIVGYAAWRISELDSPAGIVVIVIIMAAILPASLAVLAVTRSPAEALHPITLGKLIKRCGLDYWIAPMIFLLGAQLVWKLFNKPFPGWLEDFLVLYALFAFYSVTGAIMQSEHLHKEVDIHEPVGPDEAQITAGLVAQRTDVLDHAYGFISRGNRDGGFQHILGWIADDPEPDSAWQWYFEQMMRWQDPAPALFFGQQYVARLLRDGEFHAAVKIMLRCRYENEAFKPLREDIEQAIAAAEHVGHEELAQALRAGMS